MTIYEFPFVTVQGVEPDGVLPPPPVQQGRQWPHPHLPGPEPAHPGIISNPHTNSLSICKHF